ncbi:MAG: glutamine synthetase [Eubacteriales bacterium]|nr:glutamine synthetase [Eubacteriales bacterium]MDY3333261.1 glutamine synthetase [Gallibacter sp.]
MIAFDFDIDRMLYCIPPEKNDIENVRKILRDHKEVKFVSLVGIDMNGNDTDEKIPVQLFIKDFEKIMESGVQTDGSSVVLPKIASLNNARIDIVPDRNANWYVDYNYIHQDLNTGLPVGTLRIPSFLVHNSDTEVGSRVLLRNCTEVFKSQLMELIEKHPYALENVGMVDVKPEDIAEIVLTSATELEFWVKTPEDIADREKLCTAQILKEHYWKRTVGPVRKALEKTIMILDKYGIEIEMGHKEVGGVTAQMNNSGDYDHIMEQLEIDWKFSTAIQAADNENMVKHVVRDIFRIHDLEVTFEAKPMLGVAGSGEHTHLGVAAKLKNGKTFNLFSPRDMHEDFLSPIGYGALMGLMKNYEVVNPFVAPNNDAFNRLKPGYEAPVCVVTSLGHAPDVPSRNRTVMLGLIRDIESKAATRFELRGPCPTANTFLIIGSAYMAMLDGIRAVLENNKESKDLEQSLSKAMGEEDFYLETDRIYRSEENIYEVYDLEAMDRCFGRAPRTVWENLQAFDKFEEKTAVLKVGNAFTEELLQSYKESMKMKWVAELYNRIVPNHMDVIRKTVKHNDETYNDYDEALWEKIDELRHSLGKNSVGHDCLLKRAIDSLDAGHYEEASRMQLEMQEKIEEMTRLYELYKRNMF